MYHTPTIGHFFPNMVVEYFDERQANGGCPPSPGFTTPGTFIHQLQCPSPYLAPYRQENNFQLEQGRSYSSNFYPMMGVEISPLRRSFGSPVTAGGQYYNRRDGNNFGNNGQGATNYYPSYGPNNFGCGKRANWNRPNKRNNPNKNQNSQKSRTPAQKENNHYSSDSGISSRSPTPCKILTDSQTESSDDRDSISSFPEKKAEKPESQSPTPLVPVENRPNDSAIKENSCGNTAHNVQQNSQTKRRWISGKITPAVPKNYRDRRVEGMPEHVFDIRRKITTPPYYFLPRAHLMPVTTAPTELIQKSTWDNLSREIWHKFVLNQQSKSILQRKLTLWRYLYTYIRAIYPSYQLFLVGSTMNGFGTDSSDVDMCLLTTRDEVIQRGEAIEYLKQILACLRHCDFVGAAYVIHAKVPILKFQDIVQRLDIDLNCNNAVGIRNTHMLYCYSRIDWRVKPLVVVIKLWAQFQEINDAKNMTISSYSLTLMVIHYLQCGATPRVLPCLHALFSNKFYSNSNVCNIDIHEELVIPPESFQMKNHQPLGELLYGFFDYYNKFDFNRSAISVRLASKVPIQDCRNAKSCKNDPSQWNYLCIEEPFDLTNTARSVYDYDAFIRIKTVFRRSFENLRDTRMLSSIFIKQLPSVKIPRLGPMKKQ